MFPDLSSEAKHIAYKNKQSEGFMKVIIFLKFTLFQNLYNGIFNCPSDAKCDAICNRFTAKVACSP